jgi:hypothetical protein
MYSPLHFNLQQLVHLLASIEEEVPRWTTLIRPPLARLACTLMCPF